MNDKAQPDRAGEVTRLLTEISAGDAGATDKLLPLVYQELRDLARARMARERPGQTLTPTALVHDAYLRLMENPNVDWHSRGHFFGAAAEAMRRILIEIARRKATQRRGGGRARETLNTLKDVSAADPAGILDLDEALSRLEAIDDQMAIVVKLRFFAGMTISETAKVMDLSPRSVNRLWTGARAWLNREMQQI